MAHQAQEAGFVSVTEKPGSDFTLAAPLSPKTPVVPARESARREYDFSTQTTTTASYRTILQEHRIPLLPWQIRREFMVLVWGELNERGDLGMSLDDMRESLLSYARANGMRVSVQMIQKLLYSLNFARCFNFEREAAHGYSVRIPDEIYSPLYPVVGVEEAIDKVHAQYLEILARDAPDIYPDAAFDLLYGDEVSDDGDAEERRAVIARICDEVKPLSLMGQALQDAWKAS